MRPRSFPDKVHAVGRRLKCGVRWHFYAWRGGPKFWVGDEHYPTSPAFFQAYSAATEKPAPPVYMTPTMVDDFLSSTAVPKGDRSLKDLRMWALRFAEHFKDAPAVIFEERGSRGEVNAWRALWGHSPKQHDMAGTHAVRVLNWAVSEGKLTAHHCHKLHRTYEVDRSEIVWTPEDREAFNAVAPEWARRILCAACETGLRPGDLIRLSASHIEETPLGKRIRLRTSKRQRLAHIPVTPEMKAVLDATPKHRLLILVSERGRPLTLKRASDAVREWRAKAGVREDLRLQDTRGTAATRLLNAGLSLAQIANHMGWSVRYAANVIEHYARVSPDETDGVLVALARAKGPTS